MLRVLLTNDDGIEAEGLQALRRALVGLRDIDLAVIAPDGNRSATARSITFGRPLWVSEVPFGDGTHGFACDGTPVDCVRMAALGLIDGFEPDVVVSGINHGSNLGDDITYSGTVAAALEAIVLGLPGIAVSQQSMAREMDFRLGERFDFEAAAAFTARLVDRLEDVPLPEGTLLNVNVPAGEPKGLRFARLGHRVYSDKIVEHVDPRGRTHYWIGTGEPTWEALEGTDMGAVHDGFVAVTPLHLDLTNHRALAVMGHWPAALDGQLRRAAARPAAPDGPAHAGAPAAAARPGARKRARRR